MVELYMTQAKITISPPKDLSDFFSFCENEASIFEFSFHNSLSDLINHMQYKPVFMKAKLAIKSDPNTYADLIIDRCHKLLAEKTIKKYRHKYDVAFASYLYLLMSTSIKDSLDLSVEINTHKLTNLWWTNMMINHIRKYVTVPAEVSLVTQIRSVNFMSSTNMPQHNSESDMISNSIAYT